MQEKSADAVKLRRAAWACYTVGVVGIGSSVFSNLLSLLVLNPFAQAVSMGYYDAALLAQFSQTIDSLIPWYTLMTMVGFFLSFLFAYYSYWVGQRYMSAGLQLSAIFNVGMQLAAIPLLVATFEIFALFPSLIASPGAYYSEIMGMISLMLVGGLAVAITGLIFLISFLVGMARMGNRTDLAEFRFALVVALLGIFISMPQLPVSIPTFQVAEILFGLGLYKLSKGVIGEKAQLQHVKLEKETTADT